VSLSLNCTDPNVEAQTQGIEKWLSCFRPFYMGSVSAFCKLEFNRNYDPFSHDYTINGHVRMVFRGFLFVG
jgi:hypothetical protein